MKTTNKNVLLIELNEFSVELLRQGIKEFSLPNISKILSFNESLTITDEQIEHRGLDPWVQWVSIHTGVPLSEHSILHLGDAPKKLKHKQFWEKLSEVEISSGIWGAMNATKGKSDSCLFFLPDPWTFGENAYPKKLDDLLALPIYYSKNYLDVSILKFISLSLKLIKHVLFSGALLTLLKLSPLIFKGIIKNGLNNAVLFSMFDLLSTALFLEHKKKNRPQFCTIFLNSIAHIQHHSWSNRTPLSDKMKFALESIDAIIGLLLNSTDPDDAVVVMNGLTQRNVSAEPPKILYRQINPSAFLKTAGIEFLKVEQLMTFDAHVFFKDKESRDTAAKLLEQVEINNQLLFQVEPNLTNNLQLFYQVDNWNPVAIDTEIVINNIKMKFFDQFQAVVARTGSHTPNGNLFSNKIKFPKKLFNHDVLEWVYKYITAKNS